MALRIFLEIFYSQIFVTPKYPDHDLTGQTVIVTGANTGLGFEAARHFTRLNAEKVILAVRSSEKGEAAKKSIVASTGREKAVEVWSLDLSSYDSVKAFAKKAESLPRIDALVENAGISKTDFVAAEGNESTITVNVISTFLLGLLLLPKLKETAAKFNTSPRLTIVTSEVHAFPTFPERKNPSILEACNDPKKSSMASRYPLSKLLEVLYIRQLAPAMSKNNTPVTLNMLNPGFCYSELVRDMGKQPPAIFRFFRWLLARTTEVGSRTLVASAVAGHETHGQYMSDGKIAKPSSYVDSKEGKELQRRVWNEVNEALEKIVPGVTKNV